jgi:hypothetical protein
MTFKGVLKFYQLGTRCWALITDDGNQYELVGGDPSLYQDGIRVTVTGKIREDLMSAANIGPILQASSVRKEEQ